MILRISIEVKGNYLENYEEIFVFYVVDNNKCFFYGYLNLVFMINVVFIFLLCCKYFINEF